MSDSDTNAVALVADRIGKRYPTRAGELVILREASLSLSASEAVVVMGPSGSGKSTLLNILGTLEPPSDGNVRIDDVDPFALAERELARFRNQWIGFVFQDHHLLPQCSVLENVLLPTLVDTAGVDRADRARQLLDRVGLSQRLDHRPAELSGGERQRVAIARSLINEPKVVLADEPTGNLDHKSADAVADLLVELNRDDRFALVVVTHSDALAERFTRRYELIDGTLSPRAGAPNTSS